MENVYIDIRALNAIARLPHVSENLFNNLAVGHICHAASCLAGVDPFHLKRLLPRLSTPMIRQVSRVGLGGEPKHKLKGEGRSTPVRAHGCGLAVWHAVREAIHARAYAGKCLDHFLCGRGPGGNWEWERPHGDAHLLGRLADRGGVQVLADILAALGQLRDARGAVVDDGHLAPCHIHRDAPAGNHQLGRRDEPLHKLAWRWRDIGSHVVGGGCGSGRHGCRRVDERDSKYTDDEMRESEEIGNKETDKHF